MAYLTVPYPHFRDEQTETFRCPGEVGTPVWDGSFLLPKALTEVMAWHLWVHQKNLQEGYSRLQ